MFVVFVFCVQMLEPVACVLCIQMSNTKNIFNKTMREFNEVIYLCSFVEGHEIEIHY